MSHWETEARGGALICYVEVLTRSVALEEAGAVAKLTLDHSEHVMAVTKASKQTPLSGSRCEAATARCTGSGLCRRACSAGQLVLASVSRLWIEVFPPSTRYAGL